MTNEKVYMRVNEKELIHDLQSGVVEILFEKVDGTNRLMKCTLQPRYFRKPFLNEQERQEHANFLAQGSKDPSKIRAIHVWDIEINDWRSFRIDKILSAQLTSG